MSSEEENELLRENRNLRAEVEIYKDWRHDIDLDLMLLETGLGDLINTMDGLEEIMHRVKVLASKTEERVADLIDEVIECGNT